MHYYIPAVFDGPGGVVELVLDGVGVGGLLRVGPGGTREPVADIYIYSSLMGFTSMNMQHFVNKFYHKSIL